MNLRCCSAGLHDRAVGYALAGWLMLAAPTFAQAPPPVLELQRKQDVRFGMPIHWDREFGILLESSGAMLEFEMSDVRSHRTLNDAFAPLDMTTARAQLQEELGKNFETSTAGPYVIGAPRGHGSHWQERFRNLLSGYNRYFETRGWKLRNPDFPLCVVILPSKQEFDRYCEQEIGQSMPTLLGFYFSRSNRCALFEVGAPGARTDWSETERTIVHEAVHQLAYNTGIHERLAQNPLWLVEGLATMLEQPGMLDAAAAGRAVESRINQAQLANLKSKFSNPAVLERGVRDLVRSNQMFSEDSPAAYALAWGLTFYLAERQPTQFAAYTQRLAQLPPLGAYPAEQRERDFLQAFGGDLTLLAAHLHRFYSK